MRNWLEKAVSYVFRKAKQPDVPFEPTCTIIFKDHRFFGYENGSIIHSVKNNADSFEAGQEYGAAEIFVGSPITGFYVLSNGSMAIGTESGVKILTGDSVRDWVMTDNATRKISEMAA